LKNRTVISILITIPQLVNKKWQKSRPYAIMVAGNCFFPSFKKGKHMDNPTWIVTLPPLLVLFFTILTKRLNISLVIGIVAGALIATHYDVGNSVMLIGRQITAKLGDVDTLFMYGFLLTLGIIIVLIEKTGGARAFARTLTKKITDSRTAETSSIVLSFFLFIDDYLSNLTVGTVMRPVTDKFRIPRAKLAYLVHSVSIPLIIIVPISSWMAWIISVLGNSGVAADHDHNLLIKADPFYVYLKSIPYIFYSFIALISLFFIVRWRLTYGPMGRHEKIARETGDLHGHDGGVKMGEAPFEKHDSMIDFLAPIVTFVLCFIVGILFGGGYHLFGGPHSLIEAFKHNNQTFLALFIASIISLTLGLTLAISRNKIKLMEFCKKIVPEGIDMMLQPVIMLTLALLLAAIMTDELHTGTYIGQLISASIPIRFMPCILFLSAATTAFLIGTSWGTIAIFIPIALPIIIAFGGIATPANPEMIPLLYPILGAILAGAACGDNISPISQTTFMAATSSGTKPLTHTATQLPYALPAIIGSAVAFLITGFLKDFSPAVTILISLAAGISICLLILFALHTLHKRRKATN